MSISNGVLKTASANIKAIIGRDMTREEIHDLRQIFLNVPSKVYDMGINATIQYAVDEFFGGPMDDILYRTTREFKPTGEINPSSELYSPRDMVNEFMMTKAKDTSEPEYTDYVYNQPPPPVDNVDGMLQVLTDIRDSLMPKHTADISRVVLSDWLTYQSANMKRRKIVCDSRFRVIDRNNTRNYIWIINTTDQVGRDGSLRVRDLDRIKLMVGEPTWLPVVDPNQLIMRVIRVSVTDLDSKSPSWDLINGARNVRRNFQLTYNMTQLSTGRAHFVPDSGYVFDVPLTAVTRIDLKVLTPTAPYIFPDDLLVITLIAQGLPTIFQYILNGVPTNHGLVTGDIISFIDFQSNDSEFDLQVNRFEGWDVTVIDPTTFSVGFDTTASVVINNSPAIYIEKYRFNFEFGFYCLL